MNRRRLLTPGPVELHPRAVEALSQPQVHHRTEEARLQFLEAARWLKEAWGTQGKVLLLTGSATAAMEALVLNLFQPGEEVWVPVYGKFSERWAEIATAAGLKVVRQDLEWGSVPTPEDIQELPGSLAGALLTHSETSTGALLDLPSLAAALRARFAEARIAVDMVTSLLVSPVGLEAWGVDAAVAGSQKGSMCPPGLSYVALAPRALAELRARGYYLDLSRELRAQERGESAWTPAINLILAVRAVLAEIVPAREELLALRQAQIEVIYRAGERLGLRPVPERKSPAVAAFWLPEGVTYAQVKEAFARRGAIVAGGQGRLQGKILRLSLMGYSDLYDALVVAQMLEEVVGELA
jgi:aspartate aminotransferase-like enzyme